MFLTRKSDYAVRCVLFLSKEEGRTVGAAEIAAAVLVPKTFLAKVLQRLAKKGIVESVKGAAGGFRLAKAPSQISLLDVIEAVQGASVLNACAVDKTACSLSVSCAVHPVWVGLRRDIEKRLAGEDFARLTRQESKD
jgi:Rrf2 family protein